MATYSFKKTEAKWNKKWAKEKTYEPKLKGAKKPFYNLMMFPYPSAEGLHIGGARTFTGVDIYGRLKRMQGYDVIQPIGLDGFGINSENYALKIGKHPTQHAKDSEKNFYRQLHMLGNGFAWEEKLETYDPEYYRWTQWIFVQMFKHGLAYRKKQAVNWCPSCQTVLSDEQAEGGTCERCGSVVERKELEQWSFRITQYAEQLLEDLPTLDWSEKIKIAQRNWIGKSEGALLRFSLEKKTPYVFLHGLAASPEKNFWPWLKKKLEAQGHHVEAPLLPHANDPEIEAKVEYVLSHISFSSDTILVAHSLGSIVALKVLEKLQTPIRKLILVCPPYPQNLSEENIIDRQALWGEFRIPKILKNVTEIVVIEDIEDHVVPVPEQEAVAELLQARILRAHPQGRHFCGKQAEEVWEEASTDLSVFTTRPDTLFGATYLVVAPEHPLITRERSSIANYKEVAAYVRASTKKKEEERVAEGKEKTGIELKGLHAVHPLTQEHIPIWTADYVLGGYGTGAIMAVPAHDARDFAFAKKFGLSIKTVISPNGQMFSVEAMDGPYEVEGYLVNSKEYDGLTSDQAKIKIVKAVGGTMQTRYRLRDWLVSRQRYWGPPIPMIFCEACARSGQGENLEMPGWYPVPEKQLPVKLPFLKDFRPQGTGASPLASHPSFYKVRCPRCGVMARRETDVSDTFLDSAWYFLRYPSAHISKAAWDPRITKKWLPVNMYIGGAEHAVLHLLYSRFVTMVFHDLGLLGFREPFKTFRAHGLITKDGAKMSKSKGNVVNPDEYFDRFGADVMRLYLAFMAPFEQGGDFRDEGIVGLVRFIDRVQILHREISKRRTSRTDKELVSILHRTIKKVGEDIEALRYNTAISALMIFLNHAEKSSLSRNDWKIFLQLLAPFAPYVTEELWEEIGEKKSIHRSRWPAYKATYLESESVTIVIQINGKVRDSIEIQKDLSEGDVQEMALKRDKIREYLGDQIPRKIIFVPNRLINIVI